MHPLLRRQLKRCGVEDVTTPPDAEGWRRFLERVDLTLKQADEDRYLMERSLAVSSEEMQSLYDTALEASRLKAEFVANMSHEIRTPMNGVMGMAELLLTTQLAPAQRDFAETIHRSADSLLVILNDILDFSKIEAGKLELEEIDFDLRSVVHEAVDLLARKAHEKGLEIACLVYQDVPNGLRGDPGRLRQILLNLIGNAIKFTETGQVTVTTCVKETRDDSIALQFEVEDTGVGIAPETQLRLFESFTQADGSTTRKYGGTGLGLTISKQLVELMQGTIGVRSRPAEGSTFWFETVFRPGKAPDFPKPLAALGNIKLLSLDDNPTNRTIVEMQVRSFGAEVASVADGESALRMLEDAALGERPFDLVLVDMAMPGMDGFQFAAEVRSRLELRSTRLVLLSSMVDCIKSEEIERAGFAGYLTKPIREQRLYDCLRMVMSTSGIEPGCSPTAPRGVVDAAALMRSSFRERLQVLLAEDNPVNRKVAVHMLELLGCAVDVAKDGEQAVEAVASHTYDLVLMDCQMPRLDGLEATGRIREQEALSGDRVWIVALTAHAMPEDHDRCLAAGMDDYLAKPLKLADLSAVIGRVCKTR